MCQITRHNVENPVKALSRIINQKFGELLYILQITNLRVSSWIQSRFHSLAGIKGARQNQFYEYTRCVLVFHERQKYTALIDRRN